MLADDIIKGNVRAAASLMRDIDDDVPSARKEIRRLIPYTGHAHIIGITGSPGVGKSTLINCMIESIRKKGETVGIVAIDPTSSFSGGAILGDRVRMQEHSDDEDVFIRSIATRGHLGGLSRSTFGIVTVLDAMGKDVIIVETVGVGQGEMDVVHLVHTNIVVMTPDMGDGMQLVKAGILETGNVFVVNKADKTGAESTAFGLKTMININDKKTGTWKPPVILTEAVQRKGIEDLLLHIEGHRDFLNDTSRENNNGLRRSETFKVLLREMASHRVREELEKAGQWNQILERIKANKIDPYTAAEDAIKSVLKA